MAELLLKAGADPNVCQNKVETSYLHSNTIRAGFNDAMNGLNLWLRYGYRPTSADMEAANKILFAFNAATQKTADLNRQAEWARIVLDAAKAQGRDPEIQQQQVAITDAAAAQPTGVPKAVKRLTTGELLSGDLPTALAAQFNEDLAPKPVL